MGYLLSNKPKIWQHKVLLKWASLSESELCVFFSSMLRAFSVNEWQWCYIIYTYPSPTKRDAYWKSQQISAINHIYLDYLRATDKQC